MNPSGNSGKAYSTFMPVLKSPEVGDIVKLYHLESRISRLGRITHIDDSFVRLNNYPDYFKVGEWSYTVLHAVRVDGA